MGEVDGKGKGGGDGCLSIESKKCTIGDKHAISQDLNLKKKKTEELKE